MISKILHILRLLSDQQRTGREPDRSPRTSNVRSSTVPPLESDHVGDMLISGMFLRMRAFPALRIPDFKTAAAADESDLGFELEQFAKLIGEEKAALLVGRAVLGARMELAQINSQVARRNAGSIFGRGGHPVKLVRGHDEQKLTARLRDDEEFFALAVAPPARGNGDAMFVIELMTEFARVKI